jgi:hypothetical protein
MGLARTRVLKEDPHALSLGALGGDKTNLTTAVVCIHEARKLRFVVVGILFKTSDAIFNRAAKAGANFKTIFGIAYEAHVFLLRQNLGRKNLFQTAQVFST